MAGGKGDSNGSRAGWGFVDGFWGAEDGRKELEVDSVEGTEDSGASLNGRKAEEHTYSEREKKNNDNV